MCHVCFKASGKGVTECQALCWLLPTHILLYRYYYPQFTQRGTNNVQRDELVQGYIM